MGLRQSAAAGTFHAIALAQLRQRWDERSERTPTLLERKVSFVARLIPRANDRSTPLDVVAEIEWAKARRILPERYVEAANQAGRSPSLDTALVANIFADYEAAKAKRNLIDFDDILILCGRHLQRDRRAADAFRWSFRHVFVDEFQDVNPLQFALLKMFVGDSPELCVVGDSRQAIYAWNGADSSYLDHFSDHFAGAESLSLRQNYRSTPEILRCASAVLPRHDTLVATRPSGPVPTISSHADDRAEARAIARALRNAHSSRSRWRDMAVLVRTNAQVALLAEALGESSVPVHARAGGRLLERPEIQDALDEMQRGPSGLSTALDDLVTRLGGSTDSDDTPPADEPDADSRRAVLDAFIRQGRDHLAVDPNATVASFVEALRAGANESAGADTDAVDVTTFHAAKGLEWDVVHLAGMERGLSPIGHAKTDEAIDEEHRLIYVALTRARRTLHLHWAQERRFGDRVSKRSPSALLDVISAASRPNDGRGSRARSARNAGAARRALRSTNGGTADRLVPDDDPVLVALKDWRRSVAKANNVPAYIVFNDRTLEAIAHERPATEVGLSRISGLGPVKLARYGDDLLRLVSAAG